MAEKRSGSLAAGAYCTVPSVIFNHCPFTHSRRNLRPAGGVLLPVIPREEYENETTVSDPLRAAPRKLPEMADRLHPTCRILGVCHPNIYYFHNLTPGWVSFNGGKPKIAIVPQCLHRLIYGPDKRATPPLDDDLVVNLCTSEHLLVHHPMLEGILLSECERLRQRSLANKLISLFRQFGGTELRLKLVWLCWLDLMTGNSLDDWTDNLKRKSEKELEEWIIDRQTQNAALTDLMDQYALLAYRTTVDDNRN